MARKWCQRVPRWLRCLLCLRSPFKVAPAHLSTFQPAASEAKAIAGTVPEVRIAVNAIGSKNRSPEDRESSVSMTSMTGELKGNRPLEEYVFPRASEATVGHGEEIGEREGRMTA